MPTTSSWRTPLIAVTFVAAVVETSALSIAAEQPHVNHTLRVSFAVSGDLADYPPLKKARILGVIVRASGLDAAPEGATLLVSPGSVNIEASFTVGAGQSDSAAASLTIQMGTPSLATALFSVAGLDEVSVLTTPTVVAVQLDRVAHTVSVWFDASGEASDYSAFRRRTILDAIATAAELPTLGALVSVDTPSTRIHAHFPVFGTARSGAAVAAISQALGGTAAQATEFFALAGLQEVTALSAPVVRDERAVGGGFSLLVSFAASGEVREFSRQRRAAVLDAIARTAGFDATPTDAMLVVNPGIGRAQSAAHVQSAAQVELEAMFTLPDAARSDSAASSLTILMGTPTLATRLLAMAGLMDIEVLTAPVVIQERALPDARHVFTLSFTAVGDAHDYTGDSVPGIDPSNATATLRAEADAQQRRAAVLDAIAWAAGLETVPVGAILVVSRAKMRLAGLPTAYFNANFTLYRYTQARAAASSLRAHLASPTNATSFFAAAGLPGVTVLTTPVVTTESWHLEHTADSHQLPLLVGGPVGALALLGLLICGRRAHARRRRRRRDRHDAPDTVKAAPPTADETRAQRESADGTPPRDGCCTQCMLVATAMDGVRRGATSGRVYDGRALLLLPVGHPLRRLMIDTVENRWFDRGVLLLILTSSAMIGANDPLDDGGGGFASSATVEWVVTSLFSLELAIKMLAMGATPLETRHCCFAEGWNCFDGLIVLCSWMAQLTSSGAVAVLRIFRVLRPLRSISRIRGLRIVIRALLSSLPHLRDVLLLFR